VSSRRQLAALVRKDLLLELRGRESVLGMATFAAAALVLFRFALGGDRLAGGSRAAAGLFWAAVVFAALLGLARTYAHDRESAAWDGLLAAPVDRALLWLSKTISLAVFLIAMEAVALPLYWLFFAQREAPAFWALAAALLLADVGLAALGALLAGLAAGSRSREVLLPVLFLPFAVPLVLAAVDLTVDTIPPQTEASETLVRLGYLALYDTVFVLLGWALFDYVVEE
jgi:heme exporter protein B